MNHRMGLVLSGGGGKGAYQAGVWKAMEETGLSRYVTAFSGTSVGALNAFLFSCADAKIAEEVWLGITSSDILHIETTPAFSLFSKMGIRPSPAQLDFLDSMLRHGIFSRKGLTRILDRHLTDDRLRSATGKIFATCTSMKFPFTTPVPFRLDDLPAEKAQRILLASSAIPVVFRAETIDGEPYIDGYFSDNTPIAPAVGAGCDVVVAVFLNRSEAVSAADFPGTRIIPIYPAEDIGGFFDGVLDFTSIPEKIQRGYEDALRIFAPAARIVDARKKISFLMEKFAYSREDFRNEMAARAEIGERIDEKIQFLKQAMKHVGE